ncbi:MAG: rubredoxin [Oscillospiraceae bacterium]
MKKYSCTLCGWVYDEELGCPEANVPPHTVWTDVDEDFLCPLCVVGKDLFEQN